LRAPLHWRSVIRWIVSIARGVQSGKVSKTAKAAQFQHNPRRDSYLMPKSSRRRCDARLPVREIARDRAIRAGELAKYLRRNRCKNWAVRGSRRCRLHGGFSTGPTTPKGKARTIAALKAGRRRWLAKLKSEGKPIPFGRKKGGHNRP